ncbi:MAG TPA: dihydrolipoamide acetyltransferase family protein [Anaerolineales bacterium]
MADIVNMPKLGFDMAEGTLVRWVVSEGERVNKGDVLAEIETDKATVEVESSHTGIVHQHLVDEDAVVPVGEPIAVVGEEGEEIDLESLLGEKASKAEAAPKEEKKDEEEREEEVRLEPKRAEEAPSEQPEKAELPAGVRASPLARRMAEEEGIDLQKVNGSGPEGRIVKADIEAYQKEAPKPVERRPEVRPPAAAAIYGEPREDTYIDRSRLRAAIGRRMVQSINEAPHFYVAYEYDAAPLMSLRKLVNATLPDEEKISVNDFIVKAVALTLREFPNLNATLDEENNQIVHFGNINVGVAVAVENGLLTVVCQNTDLKSVRQISAELKPMIIRAREGKVKMDDIEGSTFSVSNLGMYGVDHFTAIINPPEAAILAIGGIRQVPVIEEGEVKPGMRMKATISIDHRVSDGAEAAEFMQALANFLEQPMRILV